jgi:murein tripeptide amidase MpaA
MSRIHVSSAFDGGNIEVVDARDAQDVRLRIRRDVGGRFFQWFYFRLSGARDVPLTIRLENAGEASYADGWHGYQAVASSDRRDWLRVPTEYDGRVLTIRHMPTTDVSWYAYFAPYSLERHADTLARWQQDPRVTLHHLTTTPDGHELDGLEVGSGSHPVWVIARQHPGETMAEWWAEGFVERLLDADDPASVALLERARFHVVPNMNPDGSRRGHLRTNAFGVNLNRAWLDPKASESPEVLAVRQRMHETGVDLCIDVHGDETLSHNFLAGPDGVPSFSRHQAALLSRIRSTWARISPDFSADQGYVPSAPGEANLQLCTHYVAETFGCLAVTLEQPFKDTARRPSPRIGWSPARAMRLGRSAVDVLTAIVDDLRD